MRWVGALVLTLLGNCAFQPAPAQVVSPLQLPVPAAPDLSGYATKTELAAGYMSKSQATSDIAGVAAQIPQPANAAPVSETVAGGTGASTTRFALQDHVHPRITRGGVVTTDGTGGWSITWVTALSAIPIVLPIPVNSTAQPVVCNVTTRTTTAATGRCWLARTLPATLTLLSALVNYDIFGSAASGISVQILAIPATQ